MSTIPQYVIIETDPDNGTYVRGIFTSKADAWTWLVNTLAEVYGTDFLEFCEDVRDEDYVSMEDVGSWEITELLPC